MVSANETCTYIWISLLLWQLIYKLHTLQLLTLHMLIYFKKPFVEFLLLFLFYYLNCPHGNVWTFRVPRYSLTCVLFLTTAQLYHGAAALSC